jgi:hypothetical protein
METPVFIIFTKDLKALIIFPCAKKLICLSKKTESVVIMKFLDKAKAISGDLRESAIGLKEAGLDKVREATDAFNAARPHLAKAGYRLVNLEIRLGIPPKLIPYFQYTETDDASTEEAKEALRDNAIGKSLLSSLLKAKALQKSITIPALEFTTLEVELTAIPAVSLHSVKTGSPPFGA